MNIKPGTWVILWAGSNIVVNVRPCITEEEGLDIVSDWIAYDMENGYESKYNVVQWDSSIEKHVFDINHGNK